MSAPDDPRLPLLKNRRGNHQDDRSNSNSNEEAASDTDYGSGVYRYPLYLQPGQFTSLEKLMFFISSILLIFLCIFIGLYARSSYSGDMPPKPSPIIPAPLPPPNNTNSYCLQPRCVMTASNILQDLNTDVDPCSDFYSYVCGNWINRQHLSEDKPKISVITQVEDTIMQQLTQLITGHPSKTLPSDRLPSPDHIIDEQLKKKVQDFYGACMNEDAVDHGGVEPLYPMFQATRELLPFERITPIPRVVSNLSHTVSYLAQRNVWALFTLRVSPDPQDPQRLTVSLWPSELGLPSPKYYDDPEIISTYMAVVADILDVVFRKDVKNEFGWKSWSAVATARRIVEFEQQMARIQGVQQTPHDLEYWSIEKLQQAAPNIEWTTVVSSLLPHGAPKFQKILLSRPDFITDLSQQVLENTNTRTLQMYLIWRTLWKYLDTLGEEFIAPRRKLFAKLLGVETRARPPRWQFCLSQVDASLGFLLGRYFLDENLNESAVVEVDNVIKSLGDGFIGRLAHLDWVTTKDEEILSNKMRRMDAEVGYPRSDPDMRSSISLAEYYESVHVDRNRFFLNVLGANQAMVKNNWARLRNATGSKAWDVTPQHVGLEYHRTLNKLEIPGAMLKSPFYELYGPEYLNFGSFGAIMSHATLQGFDKIGRLFNDQGKFGTWWSNETRDAYDTKAKCFAGQYSCFSMQGPDGKDYYVDGERTLDSNIADNGGLLHAYISWQQRFASGKYNNDLLPGLDAWTRDQLFYINFARMSCSKSTTENNIHEVLAGMHAPDKWRVNGAVMNSEHFAESFSCPVDSAMNPRNKCNLW